MQAIKYIIVTLLLLVLYTATVVFTTWQGVWHAPLTQSSNPADFMEAAKEEINKDFVGNASLALLEKGEVVDEYFYSVGNPVDRHTVFQVASMSKWISAWGVMNLVEEGKLALDTPVGNYLTRWQLPPSEYDNQGVTVRRLLSHTAGLTDGLGYTGFAAGTPVPTLEESLTHTEDAIPQASGKVVVGRPPGRRWQYSGGGYTLLQLLVEEVSGQSFNAYMDSAVFTPLGMNQSTYIWADSLGWDLADFYDTDLTIAPHYRYAALAAASLYTNLADLVLFSRAHLAGSSDEPIGCGVLQPETVAMMRAPTGKVMGIGIWGLGTVLYADNNAGDFIIGHDGGNGPAINTAFRLNPTTGDGIIVLETGSSSLATTIGSEWVYWKTGNLDVLMFQQQIKRMTIMSAVGGLLIITIMVIHVRRKNRKVSNYA